MHTWSTQSWPLLANLFIQRDWLTTAQANEIAAREPAHSAAWLQEFLSQNQHGFTAGSLADACAKVWRMARAGAHEVASAGVYQTAPLDLPIQLDTLPQSVVVLSLTPLCLGIVDCSDLAIVQRVQFLVNQPIEWRVLSVDEYQSLHVAQNVERPQRFSGQGALPEAIEVRVAYQDARSDGRENSDAPVVRYLQELMQKMVRERASDLHFEPFSNHYRIRARVDGVLHDVATPDFSLKDQLSVRLKVMAQLDISEKRVPQDGRVKLQLTSEQSVDCRVSTLPTLFGEKIVVRFLNTQTKALQLSDLGFEPQQLAALDAVLARPHGLVLMTGPTGSGKTVSLYACLAQLNTVSVNILTVEDPVEIFMAGVNQVSINEKAGVGFATALRAFLRQDPDILMVGEVRDLETADISLKAAQTGHLVFSTLHTNDAPLALTRLSQMGVAPYHIAASVSLIVAQRLVRRLCSCKTATKQDAAMLISAGLDVVQASQTDWQAYAPKGCERCHYTGFYGRIGVFQVLPISAAMQSKIAANASAQSLSEQAALEGVLTLRQAGLLKVMAGECSLKEVMSATT
jgi:type IV pilus assembly protein PilB